MDASEVDAASLYSEQYFHGSEYGDYVAMFRDHEKNFEARFRDVKRMAPGIRSVFEIGCAYGYWLKCVKSHGLESAGVDICKEAALYASEKLGQQAVAGDFLTLPIEKGRFDAFCMWDTIEHLAHPEDFILRIHKLLPPKGSLFISTGDIGSLAARWRGPKWRLIHPPTHLQYFSRDTLTRFLDRLGFTVEDVRSISFYRSMDGVLSGLARFGQGPSKKAAAFLSTILPNPAKQRGFWLNLGDIMFVAAHKK